MMLSMLWVWLAWLKVESLFPFWIGYACLLSLIINIFFVEDSVRVDEIRRKDDKRNYCNEDVKVEVEELENDIYEDHPYALDPIDSLETKGRYILYLFLELQ